MASFSKFCLVLFCQNNLILHQLIQPILIFPLEVR